MLQCSMYRVFKRACTTSSDCCCANKSQTYFQTSPSRQQCCTVAWPIASTTPSTSEQASFLATPPMTNLPDRLISEHWRCLYPSSLNNTPWVQPLNSRPARNVLNQTNETRCKSGETRNILLHPRSLGIPLPMFRLIRTYRPRKPFLTHQLHPQLLVLPHLQFKGTQ